MKKTYLVAALLISISCISSAAKWRVNNNVGVSADFTTAQLAHDGASAGDTLYIEGSAVTYGNINCSKQLYIYGPGYFLAENDSTQANPSSAMLETVTFSSGSLGSLISGFKINSRIDVNESNITIKRNRLDYQGIRIMSNASNIMILQNYITVNYSSASYEAVSVATGSSNVFIQNNYLERNNLSYLTIEVAGTASAQITNNVIAGNIDVVNSTFNNNIATVGTLVGSANGYNNNLGSGIQFPATNGNQQNVDMLTVFDSTQTSTDGVLKLIALSPAIAAGLSGEDCGMFGGLDPYRLSGIPAMPSIFFFQAPSSGSASTGLPINIKIKSNN